MPSSEDEPSPNLPIYMPGVGAVLFPIEGFDRVFVVFGGRISG